MTSCECRGGRHPASGCPGTAVKRWHFPAAQVYEGEPGYIDLCGACVYEWSEIGLTAVRLTDAGA